MAQTKVIPPKKTLAERLNDTVPDARTVRMTRLQTFRASLP